MEEDDMIMRQAIASVDKRRTNGEEGGCKPEDLISELARTYIRFKNFRLCQACF
jgi:hypothetical protein